MNYPIETYDLIILCEGFHGPYVAEIRGHNWRAGEHNDERLLFVDMTDADARRAYAAQPCNPRHCTCGTNVPLYCVGTDPDGNGVYRIHPSLVDEQARAECPEINAALVEIEGGKQIDMKYKVTPKSVATTMPMW